MLDILKKIDIKKTGIFAAGVLFGTAGVKVLGSKDAKKVYTNCTAAVLRAKSCVMKTATSVQENAGDILAEAKQINEDRAAEEAEDEVKEEVAQLKAEGKDIALAVIQVGADPASSVYVRNKKRACEYVGIESVSYELPEETTQEELMAIVDKCNKDPKINGILVQLPLPKHLDEDEVLLAIDPKKDVDGFHPVSVGNMVIGEKGFLPCTPAGVIQLLKRSGVEIDGKECVVVGRSNIVGKPMAMLLLRENGTVTVCHSHTKDLKEVCKRADLSLIHI